MTWSRRHTLIAGLALIALTNAVALGGVAWNRGGEPESVLKLTQRELWQDGGWGLDREGGGVQLNLRWRVLSAERDLEYYGEYHGAPGWLDRAKLASLGFDVSPAASARAAKRGYERPLPRGALIVLELDGPARRAALERAKDQARKEAADAARNGRGKGTRTAAEFLEREETMNSRLFAVDAGLDAAELRAKYPDRARYAIVHGRVRVQFNKNRTEDAQWKGYVEGLDNYRINMPLEFRRLLPAQLYSSPWGTTEELGPPFEMTVAFGRRLEPWITAAAAGQPESGDAVKK